MKKALINIYNIVFGKLDIQVFRVGNEKPQRQFHLIPIAAVASIIGIVLFIFIVSYIIIAYTNVRKFLPNYKDILISEEIENLQHKTDSLDMLIARNAEYTESIKKILSGLHHSQMPINSSDMLPEAEIATTYLDDLYALTPTNNDILLQKHFFPPIYGTISSPIDIPKKHYGTDIIPNVSDIVKSTLDGVVVFAGWTVETGNVIIVSHSDDIISVYKHNSTLLKDVNDYVKSGEAIAIAGNSGELTSGRHLHFELWHKNKPVNALEYITF